MIAAPEIQQAFRQPEVIAQWDAGAWDRCIRQAHRGKLTCRLAQAMDQAKVASYVPGFVRPHLHAARVLVDKHRRDVDYEIRCIEDVLRPLDIPVLLLKGAAYVAARLPLSTSRLFHDVDIMVPHARLADVETRLRNAGWTSANPDSYDQSYYRRWSHELPPMVHAIRGTTLDVHHTILPPTATPVPDPEKLMASARRVRGRVKVLEPVDMFLHSATHLFHEGEFDHGLRDLMDLRDLLETFAEEEAFEPRLVRRAREFGLERITHHALHLVDAFFGPGHVPKLQTGGELDPGARRMMDALFNRALLPTHPSCDDHFTAAARFALYVRGHWLRMPPRLLIPHLARKAIRRVRGEHAAPA